MVSPRDIAGERKRRSMCCHKETEVAAQVCCVSQSQHTDTQPTSSSMCCCNKTQVAHQTCSLIQPQHTDTRLTSSSMCCCNKTQVAHQTCSLIQPQHTDTRLTSSSTDPVAPGSWQNVHTLNRQECCLFALCCLPMGTLGST